jgi:hypothetical protein
VRKVPSMEGCDFVCVKESLGQYELMQRKPWFDEECL